MQILKTWLQVGVEYVANFVIEELDEMDSRTLSRQWESLTVEQCSWEIIEVVEKTMLKKPKTARDDLVASMGKDLEAKEGLDEQRLFVQVLRRER